MWRLRGIEIACPTLILVGEHDPRTPPRMAYELRHATEDAKITVIPDASYIVTIKAPDAVNHALRAFLNQLEGRSAESRLAELGTSGLIWPLTGIASLSMNFSSAQEELLLKAAWDREAPNRRLLHQVQHNPDTASLRELRNLNGPSS